MKGLAVEHVSHTFGDKRTLCDVSLTVKPGELVCLLGPSGCGKTTLLRLAAGLEGLQVGRITIGADTVAAPGVNVPPEKRGVGLMFQDFALFPHLSILDNVMFGLEGLKADEAQRRAMAMLDRVGMADFANAYAHTLSGGQQQRVALARALAPRPRVMLLDEPFSDLDTTLRAQVREETVAILKESGPATLLVTHDPEEAMAMADRIKVMDGEGRIVQAGTPEEIYFSPANSYVASLFGKLNRMTGTVEAEQVKTPLGTVPAKGFADGADVEILVRPEGIGFAESGAPVEVAEARLLGRRSQLRLRSRGSDGGHEFVAHVQGGFRHSGDCPAAVSFDPAHTFVFART
ncbi:MAG: ABC transporter ATP-binding protein [Rhodospirillales bacterium]|nr:ABC transporter ATP-binding protein [Rhodospirillales bacterium]